MWLTSKIRIVNLDVAKTVIVENLKFCLISFGDIGKVILVARIHVLRVRYALLIPHMVPLRRSECDLALMYSLLGNDAFEILPLIDIGTADMLDLTDAYHDFARLVASLRESGDIGHVQAKHV